MGLDMSHDAWHGAYSAFHRWREQIAKCAGLPPLGFMEGFWSEEGGDALSLRVARDSLSRHGDEYGASTLTRVAAMFPIHWECLRPDPLHVLLTHSDCDGEIAPADCAAIADRLEALLPSLPKDPGAGHIGDWREKTQKVIDGMRRAAAAGEPLRFG